MNLSQDMVYREFNQEQWKSTQTLEEGKWIQP